MKTTVQEVDIVTPFKKAMLKPIEPPSEIEELLYFEYPIKVVPFTEFSKLTQVFGQPHLEARIHQGNEEKATILFTQDAHICHYIENVGVDSIDLAILTFWNGYTAGVSTSQIQIIEEEEQKKLNS